jgi:hypothetical protein
MSGWKALPLVISPVSLMPVLIDGTLYTFDSDMKKLSKTV